MNISRENTGDLTAVLRVEIAELDYAENVKKALGDLRKKANIPGFRAGKVPFGVVNKMYGKSVLADEVNKMLGESLNNYITENKLNILGQPLPSVDQKDEINFETQKVCYENTAIFSRMCYEIESFIPSTISFLGALFP